MTSNGKLSVEKALDLTLYLKHETEIMPVFQGLNELIPMYKLMEKRDMNEVENQFKVEAFTDLSGYLTGLLFVWVWESILPIVYTQSIYKIYVRLHIY